MNKHIHSVLFALIDESRYSTTHSSDAIFSPRCYCGPMVVTPLAAVASSSSLQLSVIIGHEYFESLKSKNEVPYSSIQLPFGIFIDDVRGFSKSWDISNPADRPCQADSRRASSFSSCSCIHTYRHKNIFAVLQMSRTLILAFLFSASVIAAS